MKRSGGGSMELFFTMLVPFLMLGVALWGLVKRVDLWGAMVDGAGDGLKVLLRIVPSLIGLLTAVYMLRASGALELAGQALSPALRAVGIPEEVVGLLLVRPVSGPTCGRLCSSLPCCLLCPCWLWASPYRLAGTSLFTSS